MCSLPYLRGRLRLPVLCALLPLAVCGQDLIDLFDMEPEARQKAVREFVETKAAKAPLSDVIGLFDPDLALGPDDLDALYFVIMPRMPREEFPLLSSQGKSMQPGVAAPALRLLGRSGNKDALAILKARLEDPEPEVAIAAAEGLGYLANPQAIGALRPKAEGLRPSPEVVNRPWDPGRRLRVSAALALAQLGEWGPFANALNEVGEANASRLTGTYGACRTTYNSPDQCRMSLKHVLMLKKWFRFVVPGLEDLCRRSPDRFAAAVGGCRHPYAVDMAYGVIYKVLDRDNASAMLPLLNSISNEIKSLYLDVGEPFFDEPTIRKVRESIRAHAKRGDDPRARLFAIAYADRLPGPEQEALLQAMQKDDNPWVRHEAAARKSAR